MVMMHLGLIIIFTMLSRIFPRLIRPWGRGSDTYYHLLAAQRLRENRFHIPAGSNGLLIPGPFDYPPLFHYILAYFPKSTRDRLEPYLGGIFDTLLVLATYLWVYYLTGRPELAALQLDPAGTAWVASLVLINCPLLFGVAYGPRAFMGTPRPLAELFTSLALMAGALFSLTGQTAWAGLTVLPAALAVLTGNFALQVLVSFSLVLAVFLQSLFFLSLPLLTIAGALIISKGHYWVVLRGYLAYIGYYANTLIHIFKWVRDRGSLKNLKTLVRDMRHHPVQVCRYLYMDNQYSALLIKCPWLFLWLWLAMVHWPQMQGSKAHWYLLAWVSGGLAAFFLTSMRRFLFLGEAERYVEYAMPALAALIALMLPLSGSAYRLFWGIMVFSGVQLIINYLFFIRNYSRAGESQARDMINFLKNSTRGRYAVLCIPTHYLSYQLAYETQHAFLSLEGAFGCLPRHKKVIEELFDKEFGWPKQDLLPIIKKYGIDVIVCQWQKIDKGRQMGINYDFSAFPVIFENSGYIIYQAGNIGESIRIAACRGQQ
jgi:hypothetical protein